jgi:hypothetical protein
VATLLPKHSLPPPCIIFYPLIPDQPTEQLPDLSVLGVLLELIVGLNRLWQLRGQLDYAWGLKPTPEANLKPFHISASL